MEQDIISLIIRHEGFCAHAYQDSRGYWTIGYGRLIDERLGGGLSRAEAQMLCRNDIKEAERIVKHHYPQWHAFTMGRYHALVSMAFNLGATRFAGFRKMHKAIHASDWTLAAHEALDSKWATQVPHRAHEIADYLRDG